MDGLKGLAGVQHCVKPGALLDPTRRILVVGFVGSQFMRGYVLKRRRMERKQ
jgi:hypothetical protein